MVKWIVKSKYSSNLIQFSNEMNWEQFVGHHDFSIHCWGFLFQRSLFSGRRPHHGLAHRGYRRTTRPGAEQDEACTPKQNFSWVVECEILTERDWRKKPIAWKLYQQQINTIEKWHGRMPSSKANVFLSSSDFRYLQTASTSNCQENLNNLGKPQAANIVSWWRWQLAGSFSPSFRIFVHFGSSFQNLPNRLENKPCLTPPSNEEHRSPWTRETWSPWIPSTKKTKYTHENPGQHQICVIWMKKLGIQGN